MLAFFKIIGLVLASVILVIVGYVGWFVFLPVNESNVETRVTHGCALTVTLFAFEQWRRPSRSARTLPFTFSDTGSCGCAASRLIQSAGMAESVRRTELVRSLFEKRLSSFEPSNALRLPRAEENDTLTFVALGANMLKACTAAR